MLHLLVENSLQLRTQDTRLPWRFLTSRKPSRCSLAAYLPERRPAVLRTSGQDPFYRISFV